MDPSQSQAMQRSADPRIYDVAVFQSVQPSEYMFSDIKYANSAKLADLPEDIDKPKHRNFDPRDPPPRHPVHCNWFQHQNRSDRS